MSTDDSQNMGYEMISDGHDCQPTYGWLGSKSLQECFSSCPNGFVHVTHGDSNCKCVIDLSTCYPFSSLTVAGPVAHTQDPPIIRAIRALAVYGPAVRVAQAMAVYGPADGVLWPSLVL